MSNTASELLGLATALLGTFSNRFSGRPSWDARRKRQLAIACAVGVGAYAGYKAYRSQSFTSTQQYMKKFTDVMNSCTEVSSETLDTLKLVGKDVRQFLASDGNDVPQTLKQLTKLLQSSEVQAAIKSTVSSAVEGASASVGSQIPEGFAADLVEKVISAPSEGKGA